MAYYHLRNESIGNESIKTHISLPVTWSLDGHTKRYTMISNQYKQSKTFIVTLITWCNPVTQIGLLEKIIYMQV